MNSADRRVKRYERRVAAREARKQKSAEPPRDYSALTDPDNLARAFHKSKRGVSWKESVQRFEASLFSNIAELRRKLLAGESVQSGFAEFDLCERGKVRHIKSVHISERVVQKTLCDNILEPVLTKPLIHDNGASIKGKGVHFALRRLICHLSRFYRQNNFSNEGYALIVDFSKFFDSIDHEKLYALVGRHITDGRVMDLFRRFVSVFGEGKSLGLGSQVSQIAAIFFPNELDHFIKEKLRLRYYGRYMDDFYIIHRDKNYLLRCLAEIKAVCTSLGLAVHEKKSRIVKLKNGVPFLKGRHVLLETGRVLRLPHPDSAKRMRRKLKKFKKLIALGKMNRYDLRTAYQSWRGSFLKRFDAADKVRQMDGLYRRLFFNPGG
jgi:hypothetical protein